MEYKQEIEIKQSIKEVKFLLKVVRIKPKTITKMTNEQIEKEEIQEAIKEIHFLIQVLQDVPVTNPISRDIQKRFVEGMAKEEKDYEEYLENTFQKELDDLIDNQIDDIKEQRFEENARCQI